MTWFFIFFGLGALWALTSPRPNVSNHYHEYDDYDCDGGGYDSCDGGD